MSIESAPSADLPPNGNAVHHYSLRSAWTEDGGEEVDVGERWGTRQSKAQGVDAIVSACVESVRS